MGDGRSYPEYRTEIERWKYEKDIETDERANEYLVGILDGEEKESNIWRENG